VKIRQVPATRVPGVAPPALPPGEILLDELYFTVQGECGFQGYPTVFVRTSHCPLRCTWCDSKHTFTGGTVWKTDDVIERVATFPSKHVCLTGGEPLCQAESLRLAERLARSGYTIEVETSGSEDIAPFNRLPETLRAAITINLDIKCPGSAMTNFNRWDNLRELRPHDQLKFILLDEEDYVYAKNVLAEHTIPCETFLHPVWGKLDPTKIADWLKRDRIHARLGLQMHKYLWGDVRGV
jgi:7-carboxy-7-deazaguanine synthase